MQQKRYLSAVTTLNRAITVMFGEDLVGVQGLSFLREQLMDLKETLLETCVGELRSAVVASGTDLLMKDYNSESEVRIIIFSSKMVVLVFIVFGLLLIFMTVMYYCLLFLSFIIL